MSLTDQRCGPINFSILFQQLLQPKLTGGQCPPVQTQGLVQLHRDAASAQIVEEAVVHAHHVLRCEPILGFVARHYRGGVQLKQIQGVRTEGGGLSVTQNLQGGRRQCGTNYLKFQKVLSTL